MKSRLKIIITTFLFALLLALPQLSFAQTATSIDLINISTFPIIPAPNENVRIILESYSTDLNGASIVWLVDGKNFAQGVGKKTLELKAPPIGTPVTVIAVIKTVEGREVKKPLIIKTGNVDLVWESEGYIPPFFQGRAHFAYENTIKFNAIPHLSDGKGSEVDPKTLIYKWTVNDKVQLDQSGYGKSSMKFQLEIPRDLEVKVEVNTSDGTEKASATIFLEPNDPSLSFYEDHPLYGVLYNKALSGNVTLTNQEMNIRAVPYSFNFSPDAPLTYLWSINNVERSDLATQGSIILRTRGDLEGTSRVSLETQSSRSMFQKATKDVTVSFTKKREANNVTF